MIIYFFILGIIFGSFANVLIYRLPLKQSIIFPFSYCPKCKREIKWYYNIPIISFIFLGGKCKICEQKIDLIYPLVELGCGIISVVLYLNFNNFVLSTVFFNLCFILFVIGIIDFKTMEVPNVLSYYLIISGILFSITNPVLGNTFFIKVSNSLIGGIVGFLSIFIIEYFGSKLFKKPAIGFGDVKIFCGIGTFLGLGAILKILFLASLVASVYILFLYLKTKKTVFGKYIPFAPFIFLGTFLYIIIFL